jgi:hypothetical protein
MVHTRVRVVFGHTACFSSLLYMCKNVHACVRACGVSTESMNCLCPSYTGLKKIARSFVFWLFLLVWTIFFESFISLDYLLSLLPVFFLVKKKVRDKKKRKIIEVVRSKIKMEREIGPNSHGRICCPAFTGGWPRLARLAELYAAAAPPHSELPLATTPPAALLPAAQVLPGARTLCRRAPTTPGMPHPHPPCAKLSSPDLI